MLIDPTPRQQPLPSIKALFGIAQSDRLSSIETIPAPDHPRLQPPRAALTQFSLSELHGSLPAPHAPITIPAPAWMLSTPESHARKPHTPSSARTVSTASVRTPSSALASPAHVSLATHYARNGHLDPGAIYTHTRTRSFSDASEPVYDFRESSEAERLECHAFPPPPPPTAPASHPAELGRRNTMAIGTRPAASSNEAVSRLHHQHHRRVSSGSSVSSNRRSRSPLAKLVHPPSSRDIHPPAAAATASSVQKTPESARRVPGEIGFGGEHVLMRVQHGEGFEFTKEFLAAKYECQYCGKRFNRPSSLKIHVNTHTGEKPYKCSFPACGRRFSVMSNMRRHSRVHAHQSADASKRVAEDEWRGGVSGSEDDDEGLSASGSISAAESSVSDSPRMRTVLRRSSPLARMHPYAHARPESPSGVREDELGQSAALFRLPLVPHYVP